MEITIQFLSYTIYRYQQLWKEYVKFKHLMANKPKMTPEDKQKMLLKEHNLQAMRLDKYV